MASPEQGLLTQEQVDLGKSENGRKTSLPQELHKTIETIDAITQRLEEGQNGNREDNLLAVEVIDSLKEVRGQVFRQLPSLIWQNGFGQVTQEIPEPAPAPPLKITLKKEPVTISITAAEELAKSEIELVDLAKKGSEEALSALYSTYFPRVYRYVLARTGNQQDSEDIAQKVSMNIMGAIDRFQWQKDVPFTAWVFKIAHNAMISVHRKAKSRPDVTSPVSLKEALIGVWGMDEIDEKLDRRANLQKVIEEMRYLPEVQRKIIGLRFFAGLSVAETARTIGKVEGNVKVIQHKAIVKLRKRLNPNAHKVDEQQPEETQENSFGSEIQVKAAPPPDHRVPEGYIDSEEFFKTIGIAKQTWYISKHRNSTTPQRVGRTNYYSKEDALAIKAKREQERTAKQAVKKKGKKGLPPGTIGRLALQEKLRISQPLLNRIRKREKVTPGRVGYWIYFTQEDQETIEASLRKRRKAPEGYINSQDFLQIIGINRQHWHRGKYKSLATPQRVGREGFYFRREDALKIKAQRDAEKLAREAKKVKKVKAESRKSAGTVIKSTRVVEESRPKPIQEITRSNEHLPVIKDSPEDQTDKLTTFLKDQDHKVRISSLANIIHSSPSEITRAARLLGIELTRGKSEQIYGLLLSAEDARRVTDYLAQTRVKDQVFFGPNTEKEKPSIPKDRTSDIPEGAISKRDLLASLGISYEDFQRLKLPVVVRPLRIGLFNYYTQDQQAAIKTRLAEIRREENGASEAVESSEVETPVWQNPQSSSQNGHRIQDSPQPPLTEMVDKPVKQPEDQPPSNDYKNVLISVSHLSDIIQVAPGTIIQTAKDLGIQLESRNVNGSAPTFHLGFEDSKRLGDFLIQKKIAETVFNIPQEWQVSFKGAADELDISVGLVVEAIERQGIPTTAFKNGKRLVQARFLPQITAFAERQQALERLIRYSQDQRLQGDEGKPETRSSADKRKLPPGAIGRVELQKKLGINQVRLDRIRSQKSITSGRAGRRIFFTQEDKQTIKEAVQEAKDERKRRLDLREQDKPKRGQVPEGYVNRQSICIILGISYDSWYQVKDNFPVVSIQVGKLTYYSKESALAIKAQRDGERANKVSRKPVERVTSPRRVEHKEVPETQLTVFASRNNLTVARVLEAAKSLGWKFEAESGDVVLNSWQQRMLTGFLRSGLTDKKRQLNRQSLEEVSKRKAGRSKRLQFNDIEEFSELDEDWDELYETDNGPDGLIEEVSNEDTFEEPPRQASVSRHLPRRLTRLNGAPYLHSLINKRDSELKLLFRIGTQITVIRPNQESQVYTIVPQDEVDVHAGKISNVSPVALAISENDKTPGTKIKVPAPKGDYEIELVSVVAQEGESLYERDRKRIYKKRNTTPQYPEQQPVTAQTSELEHHDEVRVNGSQEANLSVGPGECAHFWQIATPNGSMSQGRCKSCGAEGEFRNSTSEFDVMRRRKAPAKKSPRLTTPVIQS